MAMYLKAIAIFCLVTVPVSHCHDDVDAFMTGDQIQQVFQADAGSVPIHEVIEINFPTRNKRDLLAVNATYFTIRAFGENISLWLSPPENVLFGEDTPVYWARNGPGKPGDVEFRRVLNQFQTVGILLEDPEHLASLVISTDQSERVTTSGIIIKESLAIKPLPHSVATEYLRKRRSINNFDSSNSALHVVYKINETFGQFDSIPATDEKIHQEWTTQQNHRIPDTLYPELLVFVDYSTYKPESSNLRRYLEYQMAYWNGVDLKYRTLESPKVRLSISALVFAVEARGTPYISNHMVNETEKSFDLTESYTASQYFFYAIENTFPRDSYDIAFTMTRLAISHNGSLGAVGFAYPAGACNSEMPNNRTAAIALGYDDGNFMGIQITAHQLGHSFGLEHDDHLSAECQRSFDTIMVPSIAISKNSSSFSVCSTEKLQDRLKSQSLTCMYNKPRSIGKSLPKLMPGKFENSNAGCGGSRGPGQRCELQGKDLCVRYGCMNLDGLCEPHGEVLDGTPCGDINEVPPRFCLQQQCVHL